MDYSDAQRSRQLFRNAVLSIGPDGGFSVNRLIYRGHSSLLDRVLASASGESISPSPGGQLTNGSGDSYFMLNHSLIDGLDVID